jgi:hypothetical protein
VGDPGETRSADGAGVGVAADEVNRKEQVMMNQRRILVIGKLALGILLLAFGWKVFSGKSISPERKDFIRRYKLIEEDMSVEQVEAIMAGYRGDREKELRELHPATIKPLKRVSTENITYVEEKHDIAEGSYFIHVYLDAEGRVVGKWLGEFTS